MKSNKKLIDKLKNDAKRLENIIEHRRLYNIRNFVVRTLLNFGIALDYALPFIVTSIIIANAQAAKGNAPFHIDEIKEKASVETIDTSNGIHLENISYDYNYNEELLEHSTGWIVNDKGLYERTVTSYRLDDQINLEDTEKIMSMTKEEIDKALVITNVRTIMKNTLTPEDGIYDLDAIIVINHFESETETFTRAETTGENISRSILYIVLVFCWGYNLKNIEKLFVKTYIRDRLKVYKPLFRHINKEELKTMRNILELKKENLALLIPGLNQDEEDKYPYKLRKA